MKREKFNAGSTMIHEGGIWLRVWSQSQYRQGKIIIRHKVRQICGGLSGTVELRTNGTSNMHRKDWHQGLRPVNQDRHTLPTPLMYTLAWRFRVLTEKCHRCCQQTFWVHQRMEHSHDHQSTNVRHQASRFDR